MLHLLLACRGLKLTFLSTLKNRNELYVFRTKSNGPQLVRFFERTGLRGTLREAPQEITRRVARPGVIKIPPGKDKVQALIFLVTFFIKIPSVARSRIPLKNKQVMSKKSDWGVGQGPTSMIHSFELCKSSSKTSSLQTRLNKSLKSTFLST